MAVVTLVSRASGYLRDKTVAALLGAGAVGDAFIAAQAVPNMFRALLAEGALTAAFVPTLSELGEEGRADRQREFVRSMTSALLVVLPLVVGAGVLAAPVLVRVVAVGLVDRPDTLRLAVTLTRLMFPYLGLISLAALAQGVLNASGSFLLPAATPIGLNLCIVAGTATAVEIFHGSWGFLAAGVVVGGVVQLAVQWPACRRAGLPLVPGGRVFRDPHVRRVLRLMVPGIPALGIYQLTLLVSFNFASTVGRGALLARFNAARLNELIYGIFIVQLTTAVLPMLSAERARDPEAARSTLGFAMRVMSVIALPSAVFTALMASRVVGTALGGGEYGPEAVRMTSGALALYAVGLPFLGLTKLLAGASYAWKNTREPVLAAAVNLAVFFALCLAWTGPYGIAGIAGAASLGQVANGAVLLVLGRRAGRLPRAGEVVPGLLRHAVAAAAMAGVLLVVRRLLPPMLSTGFESVALLVGTAALAGVTYLGVLVLLGAEEWRDAARVLRRRRPGTGSEGGGGA